MRNIAVIGAGQMGTGIAQTVAAHGMNVMLADIDLARAEAGKANVEKALVKLMGRGKIEAAEAESLLARITPVADYAPFAEADLIVEAATEREEIKNAIFEAAGKVLAAGAIMASNTSSIPITRMANHSPDPARFIGLHFFNPVPLMGLVEVVSTILTDQEVANEAISVVEAMGMYEATARLTGTELDDRRVVCGLVLLREFPGQR